MPHVIQFLKDLFAYEACFICHKPTCLPYSLCKSCISSMQLNRHYCSRCANPLNGESSSNIIICGNCQKTPPYFNSAHVPLLYEEPLKQLIWQFKYQQKLFLVRDLSKLLINSLDKTKKLPELLLPVPLHDNKLCLRGYNQSYELARMLGQQLNIPVVNDWLVRQVNTQSQQGLKFKDRRKNVKNAFKITKNAEFKDRHIALVDDVMTTGSTLNELARLILKQSNATVDVWCIARA